MTETWLRPNRRVFLLGAAVPLLVLLLGGTLASGLIEPLDAAWVRWLGGLVALGGLTSSSLLLWQAWLPRVGYRRGLLRLNLRLGRPVRVPLDLVEGFLLGQGPSWLPAKNLANAPTRTLVIRLAERAPEWQRVEVFPPFANWCDHYVTVRGAWCEPLSVALVTQLNARLHETKLALAQRTPAQGGASQGGSA
jgi:hypothetical protein